ncbi:MAG: 3-hydroxyacyl-CoA dehydrogenase NAD-binding domain-containing protein, partial [Euryarchaeota archaeon]
MEVRTVAVIGAGTMGAGIAQVCAQTGWQTRLYDAFPEGLEKGMNTIVNFWDKGISRGKTTEEEKAKWSANITQSTDLEESVEDVDLVIEAVPENMELKQQIFSKLEEMAPPHAILATNTSGLPISAIAESTNCPERIIGMHFFNPVPIMKLLEIVRHDSCSEETTTAAQSIGSAMGKETI